MVREQINLSTTVGRLEAEGKIRADTLCSRVHSRTSVCTTTESYSPRKSYFNTTNDTTHHPNTTYSSTRHEPHNTICTRKKNLYVLIPKHIISRKGFYCMHASAAFLLVNCFVSRACSSHIGQLFKEYSLIGGNNLLH